MRRDLLAGLVVAVLSANLQWAHSGSVKAEEPFTGGPDSNWGWEEKRDPKDQLSGTDQMTYTFLGANESGLNEKSFVTDTVKDAARLFPRGTGTITMKVRVDLTNYPTGAKDFQGPAVMELASSVGNKSAFTKAGTISQVFVTGFNNPGQLRFMVMNSLQFAGAKGSETRVVDFGTNPNGIPLIFDLTLKVTVSGTPGALTLETSGTVEGPVDSKGTMGKLEFPAAKTTAAAGWTGLKEVNAYRVGVAGAWGKGVTAGNSITWDSFSAEGAAATTGQAAEQP